MLCVRLAKPFLAIAGMRKSGSNLTALERHVAACKLSATRTCAPCNFVKLSGNKQCRSWLEFTCKGGIFRFGCSICREAKIASRWGRGCVRAAGAIHLWNLKRHADTGLHQYACGGHTNIVLGWQVPPLIEFRNMLVNMRKGTCSMNKLNVAGVRVSFVFSSNFENHIVLL